MRFLLRQGARRINIDSICSFECNSGVVTADYVVKMMELLGAGSHESVYILQNKV